MNHTTWWRVLIVVFALALVGALAFNLELVHRSRTALVSTVLRNPSAIKTMRFHLAAIVPDTDDPFYAKLIDGLKQEADKQNAALQIFAFSPLVAGEESAAFAEMRRWFDIAMRSKVDGIVLFQPEGLDITDFAQEANRANIPFIPMAIDAPLHWSFASVSGDSLRQGKEAARLALGLLGTSARIGIILSSDSHKDTNLQKSHSFLEHWRA